MSELDEFKKVVSPIAYGLAYKSELGTTEYQQLYAEEDVVTYFENKPQLMIPKSVADSIKIGKSKLTPALAIRWKGSLYNLTTGNIKLSKESLNWVLNGKSEKEVEDRNLVLFAYLNPLTRDLVKVVEG